MDLDQFNVDADVRRAVTDETLRQAVAQFHSPGECASCRHPLGTSGRFSLAMHDTGHMATLRPCHAPCMPSVRDQPAVLALTASTYRTLPVVLPLRSGDQTRSQPVVLVNPSVDQVTLVRASGDDAPLVDNTDSALATAGWVPAGGQGNPLTGQVGTFARYDGDRMTLSSMLGDWDVHVPAQFADAIPQFDGCFAAVVRTVLVDQFATDPAGSMLRCYHAGDLWTGRFVETG